MGVSKKDKIFPFLWPWKTFNDRKLGLTGIIRSRAVSISYLVIIWSLVSVLGYASTKAKNCGISWEMELYCKYAFWIKNLVLDPHALVRSIFTTLFLHNSIDHILYVSILGVILIVQSFEAQEGSKNTIVQFMIPYLFLAPIFAVIGIIGITNNPNDFFQVVLTRSWVGGSLGMFQVYGALANNSRKPYVMLTVPIILEIFNYTVLDIDPQIPIMHITCVFCGFTIYSFLSRK